MPEIDAAALTLKRQQSLLDKWAAGKRLAPGEREEIADLLPKPVVELKLEAQVEGKSEKKYQRARGEYVEMYGELPRTINRWMQRRAPLDEPRAMAGWWASAMKHRVPAKLLELARSTEIPDANTGVGAGDLPASLGMSQLDQARDLLESAYRELKAAETDQDRGRIALARASYNDASEQLRRVELAAPKIAAAAGSVVDKETLRSVLTGLHTSLAQSVRSFAKRMRRELTGKTAAEQEALWQEETDKLFAGFRNCEFCDPV